MAAFTIGENVEQDLLVLPTAEMTPEGIEDDSVLRVQGTVREVSATLADQDDFLFEEGNVDDGFLSDFQDEVAIATRTSRAAIKPATKKQSPRKNRSSSRT